MLISVGRVGRPKNSHSHLKCSFSIGRAMNDLHTKFEQIRWKLPNLWNFHPKIEAAPIGQSISRGIDNFFLFIGQSSQSLQSIWWKIWTIIGILLTVQWPCTNQFRGLLVVRQSEKYPVRMSWRLFADYKTLIPKIVNPAKNCPI